MMSPAVRFPPDIRFFTISTAGHVDHGKTSLIRALTGIDPDRLKEEKERQMTTDLGFAHLKLSDRMMAGFVDVPGHGKFLKNMLAGVGGVDLALVVVAADEGAMPQTVQHVRILSLLGVRDAVVAVSKSDLVDSDRCRLVLTESQELLALHGMRLIAGNCLSSTRGEGLEELKRALAGALAALPERTRTGGAFLPVDRVFTKSGFGTVVTGTLVRGSLTVGDQIRLEPVGFGARIRRLETFGQQVPAASAGQRLACNIVLREHSAVARGVVISTRAVTPARLLIVSIVDDPPLSAEPLRERLEGQPIRLYHGTAECHGYLRWVEPLGVVATASGPAQAGDAAEAIAAAPRSRAERSVAVGTGTGPVESDAAGEDIPRAPGRAAATAAGKSASWNNCALGYIALEQPVVAEPGDRYVIRLGDDTIYGGELLVRQRPRWLNRKHCVRVASFLLSRRREEALLSLLAAAPHGMLKMESLDAFLPEPTRDLVVEGLLSSGKVSLLGAYAVTSSVAESLRQSLAALVAAGSSDLDVESGVSMERVRSSLSLKIDRQTFQQLVELEVAAGNIVRRGDRLMAAAGAPQEQPAVDVQARSRLLDFIDEHPCVEIEQSLAQSSLDRKSARRLLQLLEKEGSVVVVAYEFVATPKRLLAAHSVLADLWQSKRNIAPSDFRDALGTTRKYAMALLTHFDDQKVTRRVNEGRVLLRAPKESKSDTT